MRYLHLQMPKRSKGIRKLHAARDASAKKRKQAARQKEIEKGQTVLNWSSKGGQKGNSSRARDGPQVVTIFMFCAKQLLEQWGLGLVVLWP